MSDDNRDRRRRGVRRILTRMRFPLLPVSLFAARADAVAMTWRVNG